MFLFNTSGKYIPAVDSKGPHGIKMIYSRAALFNNLVLKRYTLVLFIYVPIRI